MDNDSLMPAIEASIPDGYDIVGSTELIVKPGEMGKFYWVSWDHVSRAYDSRAKAIKGAIRDARYHKLAGDSTLFRDQLI